MSTLEVTKEYEDSMYNIVPTMYNETDNQCIVTCSSYADNYPCYMAFNHTIGAYNLWHSSDEPKPDWICIEFPDLVRITDYWFTTRVNDASKFPLCVPKDIALAVFDESLNETIIDEHTDLDYLSYDDYVTVKISLDTIVEAKAFKFIINDTYFPKNRYVNIGEIQYLFIKPISTNDTNEDDDTEL